MSEQTFDIIFRGDIQLGQNLPEVKQRLGQLFNADSARIEQLFSGRPVALKRQLDAATAERYRAALLKAGALVSIAPSSQAAPTPAPPPVKAAAQATQNNAAAPATANAPSNAQSGWSLAPAGSDLLSPAQRKPSVAANINTQHLSLRAATGNLLDSSEQVKVAVAAITIPALEVAEVGSDLLRAEEKLQLPLVEITPEDWDIAPAGSDLLLPSERAPQQIRAVDTSHLQLAAAGSDLGQLKTSLAPLNPDTSALSLVE